MLILLAVSFTAQSETLEQTRDVLKFVESEYNVDALGDFREGIGYTAFGVLQIRKIAIDDVNRVYGTDYTIQDAFSEACSDEIFELYINHWTDKLEKREGRKATTEDVVRIWNGGPLGYTKGSTKWYLKKFLKYRKNRYLCDNEANSEQSKMHNQREVRNSYQKVYAYSGYFNLHYS